MGSKIKIVLRMGKKEIRGPALTGLVALQTIHFVVVPRGGKVLSFLLA